MRRRWFTVAVAASGAFIAVYVPHVVRVGAKVVGFLPGYLQQENYTSGSRYGIIGLFIIGPLATVVALLILAAVALAVLQFSPPDRPWSGAVVMTAAALAVALVVVAAGWLIRNERAKRAAPAAEPVTAEPMVTELVVTEPVAAVPEGAVAEVAEPESVGRKITV
jgi:hypothetical protein